MLRSETPIFAFRGPMGVRVEVSGSIIFLALIFVGVSATSTEDLMRGAMLFAIVVTSIFAHEFGHAWGAKVQGVKVEKVVLHGGGGYCQHAATGRDKAGFIVAMGPVVNLALWAISSLIVYYIVAGLEEEAAANLTPNEAALDALLWKLRVAEACDMFAKINLVLFALNMVPVQPLDGGRLLHLGLLRVFPQPTALRVAGAVGLVFAVIWFPAMLLLYFSMGWILLFFPAIGIHWRMAKGEVSG